MTFGSSIARWVLGAVGIILIALGIGLFLFNGPFYTLWFWMVVGGIVVLIGVIIEASRYRSLYAEKKGLTPGPGGGEQPGALEPRFRATDELFEDPTSHLRMRVYVDSRTGERRYVAEG